MSIGRRARCRLAKWSALGIRWQRFEPPRPISRALTHPPPSGACLCGLFADLRRVIQSWSSWRSAGAARSKRAARRCVDGLRAPSCTRCAFATLFLVAVSILTRCRRRRAASGAISSNFEIEWSVCGFERGGTDGRRRDPYERHKLRTWVCAACCDPAAAWRAVPREIA